MGLDSWMWMGQVKTADSIAGGSFGDGEEMRMEAGVSEKNPGI